MNSLSGRGVMFRGDAGIGKSRLLEVARKRPRPTGAVVLAARGALLEGDYPFGVVRQLFDLRPAAIGRDLDLRRPIYKKTAAYGHFGRSEKEFTWEATPRVDDLRSALGL